MFEQKDCQLFDRHTESDNSERPPQGDVPADEDTEDSDQVRPQPQAGPTDEPLKRSHPSGHRFVEHSSRTQA
jgi:hypothetical protein